jgi:hypothetical protein
MITEEARALWLELYGEPAPDLDGSELLARICCKLDIAEYDRVQSPFLRASLITRPEDWRERQENGS